MFKRDPSDIKAICFATLLLSIVSCGEKGSQPKGMLSENLNCPAGSLGYIDRYGGVGKNQWVHSCRKSHGPYRVWHNEVLIIEGQYLDGNQSGVWIYRDDNGNVKQTINYDKQ